MPQSILYVCNEDKATTKQRLLALGEMNVELDIIYTYLLSENLFLLKRIWRGIQFRLGFFPVRNNENKQILKQAKMRKFDVLFVEKGLSIYPGTLRKVKLMQPAIKIVSYTLDDVMNPNNLSRQYKASVPLYDFHFTNKKYNVAELKSIGAKNVIYFRNAYSTHVHRPVLVNDAEKTYYGADVTFIGTYEEERAICIRYLAEKGLKIKLWGWSKSASGSGMEHANISINRHVYDDEFAKVVCSSAINLCFLRKENRDTETTRSMEIPACGGFMLAERTKEHLELFKEDIEAAYFDSKEELLNKSKLYLMEWSKRKVIAQNGLAKCIQTGFTYHGQMKFILSIVLARDKNGEI